MPKPAPLAVHRLLRSGLTALVTLSVAGAAAAAVMGGVALIGARGEGRAALMAAPPLQVDVLQIEMVQGYDVTRRFIGQIEAATRADLAFELGGRITEVLVEEGDVVAPGSVLARLDTSALVPQRAALVAELTALAADAELAQLTLSRNDVLAERGFRSVAAQDEARLTLARAQARMAAVQAQIAGVDVQLEKSVLTAPFAARIGARLADPGQTVAAGQSALVLFDTAPPLARIGLPPELAARLAIGARMRLVVGGTALETTLRQLRPDLDPVTRSRSVVVAVPQAQAPVLGDTVALELTEHVPEPGFWAPLSALREGARGSWSVMALEQTADGPRTRPAAVEVLHMAQAHVFLRGALPPGARIIAQAPDRVAAGQLVVAQAE